MAKNILFYSCLFLVNICTAQSDYISNDSRHYNILNRLEIKLQRDSILNFSAVKPFERKHFTEKVWELYQKSKTGQLQLSKSDQYNLQSLIDNNFEWKQNFNDSNLTFKKFFSGYKNWKPAYAGIKTGGFSIYAAPILSIQFGKDQDVRLPLFQNTRGMVIRGTLSPKIGFYSYFTENQERNPLFVNQWVPRFNALPGAGFIKTYNNDGFDYMDVRGGIMVNAGKGINLQFAYDRVFIGNGYRSLIISDFAQNFLFLKMSTRIWKFNYYNLFGQMTAAFRPQTDGLRPQKYMALHYLDFQVNKWLNLGLFEHIMFGRQGGFDLNYLNPVIFYRAVEQQLGSPDKATLGLNIKANAFKNTQLYGQLVINELIVAEALRYKNGWWGNKHALQMGVKMIDIFKLKNVDAQFEVNLVRPYTYTSKDSLANFSHYNQPLAHPLGANFREFIAILRAQPLPKLNIVAKLMYYEQGLDSSGRNMGNNILLPYTSRPREYAFKIGSGSLAKCLLGSITASYEFLPNAFFDINATVRRFRQVNQPAFDSNIFSTGIRLNIGRREFEF